MSFHDDIPPHHTFIKHHVTPTYQKAGSADGQHGNNLAEGCDGPLTPGETFSLLCCHPRAVPPSLTIS